MRKLAATLCLPVFVLAGCASAQPKRVPAVVAPVCGDAKPVHLTDPQAGAAALSRLFGTHYAELVFTCPSEEPCALPADRQIELTLEPLTDVACEFASCRVPYLATLPFARGPDNTCPSVLWSRVKVHMKSDAGTFDEHDEDVDLLGTVGGEALIRFVIESPAALRAPASTPETRSTLLDIQIQLQADDMRGQVAVLAAPLASEPAGELHFAPLWTATWQLLISH